MSYLAHRGLALLLPERHHLSYPLSSPAFVFVPAGPRYSRLPVEDYFIVTDGEVLVGSVRLIDYGLDTGLWQWVLLLVRAEPLFPLPTNGTSLSKAEAERELAGRYEAFQAWLNERRGDDPAVPADVR